MKTNDACGDLKVLFAMLDVALHRNLICQEAAREHTGAEICYPEEFVDLYADVSAEGRTALFPFVDTEHYARLYRIADPVEQLMDFAVAGPRARRWPHPLIDFGYVERMRPDLRPELASTRQTLAIIADYHVALSPWLSADPIEAFAQLRAGRLASEVAEWVDPAHLLGQDEPSSAAAWQAILDFASFGDAQGQSPSRRFDPGAWNARRQRTGVAAERPFFDFLIEARINGFSQVAPSSGDLPTLNDMVVLGTLPARQPTRATDSDSAAHNDLGKLVAFPRSAQPKPLAVCLHAFYPDVARRILDRLAASALPMKLYVTTMAAQENEVAADMARSGLDHELCVVENRGRDIAPFLAQLPKLVRDGHDCVLKLHTKKSLHRPDGRDWADALLRPLTDPDNLEFATEMLRRHTDVGFVGLAGHVLPLAPYMYNNGGIVSTLVRRLQLDVRFCRQQGHFMAGSMFIARLAALELLAELNLVADDFDVEAGQLDGTLAHGIERVVALSGWRRGQKLMILDTQTDETTGVKSFY
ncbi:rhamnan synthesis F family protein [Oceaniovalibus sp. ACAM 378]|uniref:rhamnan synthesis F family protein n=1 Tax=Oceaniovalibus sp. ACAM 378 TaxID=2599923 RepID=UPI0011D97FDB|nr:rhamnan synthesis F family protein [Oceaniovalibus sp. ACAM 378]TYB89537.1 hypothetical protein FQ320_08635 [Oceaniovalibus sp. ACAM 378]